MMKSVRETYGYAGEILQSYWSAYGGFAALRRSPFLHVSLLAMIPTIQIWIHSKWWDMVLNVMPSMLGFSLGGYAILLAVSDTEFLSLISGTSKLETEKTSPFLHVNANFLHFILMQFLALAAAILADARIYALFPSHLKDCVKENHHFFYGAGFYLYHSMWFIGFLIFVYAIATGLAATFSIFEYGVWYDEFQTRQRERASYKNASYVCVKSPSDCSEPEIRMFSALVEKGNEVNADGLEARIRGARYLAFIWFQKKIIGVGALKRPHVDYRQRISSKSGVDVSSEVVPYELGWVYVVDEARGVGLAKDLCERLLRLIVGESVFATVRVENLPMRRALSSLGFEETGRTYLSNRAAYELQVFIKHQPSANAKR